MKKNPIAIIGRAIAAGVVAGCIAAIFFLAVGRSTLDETIAFEEANATTNSAVDEADEAPAVEISRQTQAIGAVVASVLYGSLLGVVFGTVFTAVRHLLPATGDLARSTLLAAVGFLSTVALPAIKYPANPPGVGNPDDVNQRTITYITLVGAAIACAVGVLFVYRWLTNKTNRWTNYASAAGIGAACFVALVVLWPANTATVPDNYPNDLLWQFRFESMTTLAILWGGTGIGTGWLLGRNRTPDA